jgi:D-xylulose 5-phosphate/D-fructose 6-phosphate phosphoketolase/XFP N-terminal domain/Peptidase family M41
MHQEFATILDSCLDEIAAIQRRARQDGIIERPRWPMIVLRSPKGWTGPKEVDGLKMEGSWRSHQVPFSNARGDDAHRAVLEQWLRSYRPEELFDDASAPVAAIRDLHPVGSRRMSANPHSNGGTMMRDLRMPDFRDYAVPVAAPGTGVVEGTRVLGAFLRDVMRNNMTNFRVMSPDENNSNRLDAILEVTGRTWNARMQADDEGLAINGRLMEMLSEHTCQGWLEGYLLTGRHGFFSCYEAFIHLIDSMFNQHAKWLRTTNRIAWRRPIASLNYLLTSHVWRQDHNGFSHQDPGFIDHVVNKKAEVIRIYLPPDANTLLSVADHCLRSRQYVNVIVAGKQPDLQYLNMRDAITHCTKGHRDLGVGQQRRRRRPRCGAGLRRRCAHDGGPRRDPHAARLVPGPADAGGQRGRPDAVAGRPGASARAAGPRLRCAVHQGPAGHLRLPRIPMADPPVDLPAHQPRPVPRARLRGGGHHHHGVRHVRAEDPHRPGRLRRRPTQVLPTVADLAQRPYSEAIQRRIDDEVAHLLRDAEQQALGLLRQHRSALDRVTGLLLEHGTIDGSAVRSAVDGALQ